MRFRAGLKIMESSPCPRASASGRGTLLPRGLDREECVITFENGAAGVDSGGGRQVAVQ